MIDLDHKGNILEISYSFEFASHKVSSKSYLPPPLCKKLLVLTPNPQKLSKVLLPKARIMYFN